MDLDLAWIRDLTGAASARQGERIQSLWAGYGEIVRVHLIGAAAPSVVVKWVKPPAARGAVDDRSHTRKCRSYEVESRWYQTLARRCDATCRVAALLGHRTSAGASLLVLEDLDAAGWSTRRRVAGRSELDACLAWLAAFHARFLGLAPSGLWEEGTYWHLATRPDELAAIDDAALRAAAPALDARLCDARFRTIVHGDAKLANFCFSSSNVGSVAAVDFQYVGGGCGMKDVAYLLCGRGRDAEAAALDVYFRHLRGALPATDSAALEQEWRGLYAIACADFYRFLAGWSKGEYARDPRARELVREALDAL